MKASRLILAFMVAVLLSAAALADHRHRPRWSVSIGVPLVWHTWPYPRYAPYRYYAHPYYYPPYSQPVIVMPPAPVYIEQPRPLAEARLPAGYWYYCPTARAYYPAVSECPEAWQPVPPLLVEPAK